MSGYLLPHIWITSAEMVLGLATGCAFGFFCGIILGEFELLRKLLYPYIIASQVVGTPFTGRACVGQDALVVLAQDGITFHDIRRYARGPGWRVEALVHARTPERTTQRSRAVATLAPSSNASCSQAILFAFHPIEPENLTGQITSSHRNTTLFWSLTTS